MGTRWGHFTATTLVGWVTKGVILECKWHFGRNMFMYVQVYCYLGEVCKIILYDQFQFCA